jgi:hypothetical protein
MIALFKFSTDSEISDDNSHELPWSSGGRSCVKQESANTENKYENKITVNPDDYP